MNYKYNLTQEKLLTLLKESENKTVIDFMKSKKIDTIKLRECCEIVTGVNYWKNLAYSNIVDSVDSYLLNTKLK